MSTTREPPPYPPELATRWGAPAFAPEDFEAICARFGSRLVERLNWLCGLNLRRSEQSEDHNEIGGNYAVMLELRATAARDAGRCNGRGSAEVRDAQPGAP